MLCYCCIIFADSSWQKCYACGMEFSALYFSCVYTYSILCVCCDHKFKNLNDQSVLLNVLHSIASGTSSREPQVKPRSRGV